ncbi:MAG TPA: TetR/AcrR family transcriptional regulator [Deltaproteobacteria bacterium]|nr:TetR/AcrR family transcriptional regulator [Deltaproteobacteria bacterium]HOI08018.1 TetR/AcrR family transcriptional regulator [Deltaproteobacteria bacterium]
MHKKNHMVPRKLPSQERSRATVAAIYEAAAQVFTRNGYYSTTTDMIAERAGVSIGTLYQYFPSKDAILVGLWENHFLQGRAILEDAVAELERSPFVNRQKVAEMIRRVILLNMEHRTQHRFFVSDIPWPRAVIEKEIELGRLVKGYIEEAFRKSPGFRIANPRVAAHVVYETAYSLAHEYILYWTEEIPMDEFVHEMADMLSRYVFSNEEGVEVVGIHPAARAQG